MQLQVYDNGEIIGLEAPFKVGPRSESVYWFNFWVTGEHEITARANSPLYDTGEMEIGLKLKAREEGGSETVSSLIAWEGMLAIILAVVAIALNLVGRRTTGAEVSKAGDGDLWMESRDEDD